MLMQHASHYGTKGGSSMVMGGGGLKKVRPEIQIYMGGEKKKKKLEYKDKFPKDLPTKEDIRKKYGTIVWCKYLDCKSNQEVKDLQATSGTVLKNSRYKPLNEQEHVWTGICTRGEIGIKYDEVVTTSRAKFKVPHCFTSSTKKTGHVDFTKFLNPDGSPLGGNIASQHESDDGYGVFDSNSIYE